MAPSASHPFLVDDYKDGFLGPARSPWVTVNSQSSQVPDELAKSPRMTGMMELYSPLDFGFPGVDTSERSRQKHRLPWTLTFPGCLDDRCGSFAV